MVTYANAYSHTHMRTQGPRLEDSYSKIGLEEVKSSRDKDNYESSRLTARSRLQSFFHPSSPFVRMLEIPSI